VSSARLAAALLVLGLVAAGCSSETEPRGAPPESTADPSSEGSGTTSPTTPEPTRERARRVHPGDFRVGIAVRTVHRLAGGIGPRHATSAAFERAAAWVAGELDAMGYDVRRQRVGAPAGVSWGVPVDGGTSVNVIATPRRFDPRRPHLVLGAHLDTVPQAPGAEDNASGVGVVLAAAEATAGRRTRLPVVLVAFGAEEPRGTTDADHHYGSRAYVAALGPAERRAVRGMLSLDRVGVGTVVPVTSAGPSGDRQRREVLASARRAGVPTVAQVNRSSDHWSFARAGLPGIRIGSTPYAAYHSAADLPPVVSRAQLARTGRLVLAWLR
jgi:Zn-dependent M28 family amino/carboxypeptidase